MVAPAGLAAESASTRPGWASRPPQRRGAKRRDYGIFATTNDTLARAPNPVLAGQAQLWGDPSDPIHDHVRGECDEESGNETEPGKGCPVDAQETAFDAANCLL